MINYIINREEKIIEFTSGNSSVEELKDLIKMFKGYTFTVSLSSVSNSFSPKLEKQGISVGAAYVSVIGRIEHN